MEFVTQEIQGKVYKLRGKAKVETSEAMLTADEIDYDEESGDAEARGNVYFRHFAGQEELWADRAEFNVNEEIGKFYGVRGQAPAKIEPRPGLLMSTNPFYFQAEWAEKFKNRYILYQGFVTNCKVPRPIWILRAPKFDIVPGQRAIAYRTWFRVKGLPLFYTPYFYKSLERQPRKSGFLSPSAGNSSRRGKMIGTGYYWAINRSYDLAYRSQLFTQRGFAHTVDLRGKPTQRSEFGAYLYGVNDRGRLLSDGSRIKEGGFFLAASGRAELGKGFLAYGAANYLSSFRFRQAFTETFNEAIFSEVQSVGVVAKHWSSFGLNIVTARKENFQSNLPGDRISVRRLPQVEFNSRDRLLTRKVLPVWVSLESTAGFLQRAQPRCQEYDEECSQEGRVTRAFVPRSDLAPRIMTALRWKDFSLLPYFSVRETFVGSSYDPERRIFLGSNIRRHARELGFDLVLPALAKVMQAPSWAGERMKHVIEPRASFRWVQGVDNFRNLIRFDETELLSNTKEVELSLTNRIYLKNRNETWEAISWQLVHKRYFDPTFGGAIVEGQRNVLLTGAQLTGYSFFSGPRRYSPLVSVFRASPNSNVGVEWRADYDPLFQRLTNSLISGDARISQFFISIGHGYVRGVEKVTPSFNQFRGLLGIGNESRRGWNAAFSAFYNFQTSLMDFAATQVTYNWDCCGLSFQYRRLGFRNDNIFQASFAIANIGSFGTLKRQERIF
ncbi:MAG: LPS assembly protein LptD [Bryobacteraceae bacterium]|nr:LPS assembly protein LptD [Bryobacteraceae bacterium]MDW8377805.1 LPS assembly protein LptD [Bryobacterales bacterium]